MTAPQPQFYRCTTLKVLIVVSLLQFILPKPLRGEEKLFSEAVTLDAPIKTAWQAITDPAIVSLYHLAPLATFEPIVGGSIIHGSVESPLIAGEIQLIDPPHKLVHSFNFDPASHPGVDVSRASRVTYELIAMGEQTRLTLTHDCFGSDEQTFANVSEGWPIILYGLSDYLAKRDKTNDP